MKDGLPSIEDVEARLCFYPDIIPIVEIRQVLRLYLHFGDIVQTMGAVDMQANFFTARKHILDVLQGFHHDEKASQENSFTRARKQIKENQLKENGAKTLGPEAWKKAKKIINQFEGKIIAVTKASEESG